MPPNRRKERRFPKGRSAEQRDGSSALTEVMRAWEDLTDMERLAWRTYGQTQHRLGRLPLQSRIGQAGQVSAPRLAACAA
jgi:hypothetical protein